MRPASARRSLIAAALLALEACGGGGTTAAIAPSAPANVAVLSLTRTQVPIPLPSTNGDTCSLTIPANNAPPGATLTVTMPAQGAALASIAGTSNGVPYTVSPPAGSAVVAQASTNVVFSSMLGLGLSCTPAVLAVGPSTNVVDPVNPGILGPPNVTVTNGTEDVTANAPLTLGYL